MASIYEGKSAEARLASYHRLLAATPQPLREHYAWDRDWLLACSYRENVIQRYSREYTAACEAAR